MSVPPAKIQILPLVRVVQPHSSSSSPASTSSGDTPAAYIRRTRISRPKVKTGCITCKYVHLFSLRNDSSLIWLESAESSVMKGSPSANVAQPLAENAMAISRQRRRKLLQSQKQMRENSFLAEVSIGCKATLLSDGRSSSSDVVRRRDFLATSMLILYVLLPRLSRPSLFGATEPADVTIIRSGQN